MAIILAIVHHEMRSLIYNRWRQLAILHPALLAAIVLIAWPQAYSLAEAAPPATFLWWIVAGTYLLGHATASATLHAGPRDDDILPHEWIKFGNAHPLQILVAKLIVGLIAAALWLCVVLPTFAAARSTAGNLGTLVPLYVYWLASTFVVTGWSTGLTLLVSRREQRAWLFSVLWTAVVLLPLLSPAWQHLSPVSHVAYILSGSGYDAAHFLETPPAASMRQAATVYGLLGLAGWLLAYAELIRWKKHVQRHGQASSFN